MVLPPVPVPLPWNDPFEGSGPFDCHQAAANNPVALSSNCFGLVSLSSSIRFTMSAKVKLKNALCVSEMKSHMLYRESALVPCVSPWFASRGKITVLIV